MDSNEYTKFLTTKSQSESLFGFAPLWVPDFMYDFQKYLLDWSLRKGRGAVFADCGLGKTIVELVFCENIVRKTNGRVLYLAPVAVCAQIMRESVKFGVECHRSFDGKFPSSSRIIVTNYERLDRFNGSDFVGMVCDESSILKNFDGATRKLITEFSRKIQYRLLCTATAAPNDYLELGTSSEALGDLGFVDMLNRFFKKVESARSRREEYRFDKYRFRGHSREAFWRWVASWCVVARMPSDLGFSDENFRLPKLVTNNHVVRASRRKNEETFFDPLAESLKTQREERRRTLKERCEKVAALVDQRGGASVCWCQLNAEGDLLERLVPDGVQVSGSDSLERKEEILDGFARGTVKKLITKPTIAGFGLNWQHCSHQCFFPTHSFEQWYQSVRRCWRFGQKNTVVVDVVSCEGERRVLQNMERKQRAADKMFAELIAHMGSARIVNKANGQELTTETPRWL